MTSGWKKSELAGLAVAVFVVATAIGDGLGVGMEVAVRTGTFYFGLLLIWYVVWFNLKYYPGSPGWKKSWYLAVAAVYVVVAFICLVVAVLV